MELIVLMIIQNVLKFSVLMEVLVVLTTIPSLVLALMDLMEFFVKMIIVNVFPPLVNIVVLALLKTVLTLANA
jgi:hypothetical protein